MINCVLYLLAGAVVGLVLNAIIYMTPLTAISASYNSVRDRLYAVALPLGIMLYCVLSPILEELLFRIGLYDLLYKKTGFIPSMFISSLAFGVYHLNLVQGVYAFIMGLFFCVVYRKDHRPYVPMILHSGANLAVYLSSAILQMKGL